MYVLSSLRTRGKSIGQRILNAVSNINLYYMQNHVSHMTKIVGIKEML